MANENGAQEEFRISVVQPFKLSGKLQGPLKDNYSNGLLSKRDSLVSKRKPGLLIQMPPSNHGHGLEFDGAANYDDGFGIGGSRGFGIGHQSCKCNSIFLLIFFIAMIGQFVNRAHLEVLKSEDLEDQLMAKKLVDIICFSPSRLGGRSRLASFLPHQAYQNQQNYGFFMSGDVAESKSENKVHKFKQPMSVSAASPGLSIGSKGLGYRQAKGKEYFWSNDFLKYLG